MAKVISRSAASRGATTEKTPAQPTAAPPEPAAANPIAALRSEVDHLFDEFSRGFPRFDWARDLFDFSPFNRAETRLHPLAAAFNAATPRANVSEAEKEFVITVDLPGMSEDDVEVTIDGDMLTIKGERSEESEEKDNDFRVVERQFGSFQRSFRLPDVVDQDKISAKFAKGVLTLTLEKSKEAIHKKRTIPIKGA